MSNSTGDGIPDRFYTEALNREAFGHVSKLFPSNRSTPNLEISGPNADIIADWLEGKDLSRRPTDWTPNV